ncbi:unnamed protein product [Paramecium sonneborni]|uniref:Uncharacterized protein n=1 Tax=Paramecium sonneborni TaxID=65129 RepID=A0A8S1JSL5_9CILI|nr:unnamed protein product [Paramecium sonneborni]
MAQSFKARLNYLQLQQGFSNEFNSYQQQQIKNKKSLKNQDFYQNQDDHNIEKKQKVLTNNQKKMQLPIAMLKKKYKINWTSKTIRLNQL